MSNNNKMPPLDITMTGDVEVVKDLMSLAYSDYQEFADREVGYEAARLYLQGYQTLLLERIAHALENPTFDPRPFETIAKQLGNIHS